MTSWKDKTKFTVTSLIGRAPVSKTGGSLFEATVAGQTTTQVWRQVVLAYNKAEAQVQVIRYTEIERVPVNPACKEG